MLCRLASLVVGLFAVACAACGQSSSPASPSPIVPTNGVADFSGIWQGQYRITTCAGERDCWARVGTTRPYVLRLTQSGSLVTGVLEAWWFTIDVGGEVTKDGTLSLSGSSAGTGGYDGMGAVRVPGFLLRLDAQQGLAGDLSYSVVPLPGNAGYDFGTVSHGGVVLNATRNALPAVSPAVLAAYEGTWAGRFVIESCSFSGWQTCYPEIRDGAYTFSLDLRVDGGALSGELVLETTRIPVTAAVSPSGLVVQGSESHVVSGGTSLTTLDRWTTSRDVYARLNGTFEYERTFVRLTGAPNSSQYQARLVGVTRRP